MTTSTELTFKEDPRFHAHMRALGDICAIWADLEYRVNQTIWQLANVEMSSGACITAQIAQPVARYKALIALVHLRGGDPDLLTALNKFSRKAEALGRQRNRFVHDVWSAKRDGTIERLNVTADRELQFGQVSTPIEDLQRLRQKIFTALHEYGALHERIEDDLPPWPQKQYEQSHGVRMIPRDQSADDEEP
jgi:hypothetical protein